MEEEKAMEEIVPMNVYKASQLMYNSSLPMASQRYLNITIINKNLTTLLIPLVP